MKILTNFFRYWRKTVEPPKLPPMAHPEYLGWGMLRTMEKLGRK